MAKHAEKVEKRRHNAVKPDAETPAPSSRETGQGPKRDPWPHAEDTPQGSHTERPLEEPWNMRGSLPAERQAAYLDTNVLLSHRPQPPTRHTAVETLKNAEKKCDSLLTPVSSTHTSHEESTPSSSRSRRSCIRAMTHHPTTCKRPCGSYTSSGQKTMRIAYSLHLAKTRHASSPR